MYIATGQSVLLITTTISVITIISVVVLIVAILCIIICLKKKGKEYEVGGNKRL